MLWDFNIPPVFLDEDKINRNAAYMKGIFCAHLLEQPLQADVLCTNGRVSIILSSCHQKWLFKRGKILQGSEQHFHYKHATSFLQYHPLAEYIFFTVKENRLTCRGICSWYLEVISWTQVTCVKVPELRKMSLKILK